MKASGVGMAESIQSPSLAEWLLRKINLLGELAAEAIGRSNQGTWDRDLLREAGFSIAAAAHVSAWKPSHVLVDCNVKRRLVERHASCDDTSAGDPCDDLRLLALLFVDYAGYREEWRP